jgi:transmembrane sensor
MDSIGEHIEGLIIRYSEGKLSDGEKQEFLSWINQEEAHRLLFREQLTILRSIRPVDVQFNTKKNLNEFQKKIDKKAHLLSNKQWLAVAACIFVLVGISSIAYILQLNHDKEICQYISSKPHSSYILSDKSEVVLSKNSILLFPKKFDNAGRKVELKGKAYFNVSKNKSCPFEVTAGNINVKVLGTRFEIEMDTISKKTNIIVQEGRISVSCSLTEFSRVLQKNEAITINQQGVLIEKSTIKNENYLAWKTGILIFENSLMKEVANELSKLYNKPFIFKDKEIEEYLLTTKISNQPLSEVKVILEKTLNIDIHEYNDSLVLAKSNFNN